MPPAKATPLKFPSNVANANTPSTSKPGSPSTHVPQSPVVMTSTSSTQLENISNPHELTAFVETVLIQLENRFDEMSTQVLDRMSQMSTRLDSLENSIQELLNEDMSRSMSSSPAPSTPAMKTQNLRGNTQ